MADTGVCVSSKAWWEVLYYDQSDWIREQWEFFSTNHIIRKLIGNLVYTTGSEEEVGVLLFFPCFYIYSEMVFFFLIFYGFLFEYDSKVLCLVLLDKE